MMHLLSLRSIFRLAIFTSAFFLAPHLQAEPALAVKASALGFKTAQDFPAKKLRGYGTISAKAWSDGAGGSLVQIECQDAEHARLLQAKYLSDLAELPPATQAGTITVNGAAINIQTADSVGSVAALRSGTTVVLAAAPSADALAKLIAAGVSGMASQWTSVAEGAVPMFLDRFDKYGFRFYYAPGELPPNPVGKGEDHTYDVQKDFDWMQAMKTGLTVWTNGQPGTTPEWLMVDPRWDWTLAMAKKDGLPFGLNLGINGACSWYFNRDPASLQQFAPDFLGTYYGSMNFGIPSYVSWSSQTGQDTLLAQIQQTVRKYNATDNITSWLEPHEELGGGDADLLVDYGPQADKTFRAFLEEKYKTIGAVAKRYENPALTSWDKIHALEPAEFLGWGPDAIDLAGKWKVSYDAANDPAALGANYDDSAWGEMNGPGYGLARFLPQKPDVWRRHFNLDAGWQGKHPEIWLYVWDMNDTRAARKDPSLLTAVSLNGQALKENGAPAYTTSHWAAYDVTKIAQPGDNLLAVRLPRGLFNYRVYLSGDAPKAYPQLGDGQNAKWADFTDWLDWNRGRQVGRGMQMIRQVDPNRGIVLMAPDSYENVIMQDAIAYGGDYHNTGYMGGWWCDRLPALMRAAGLPFSTEPSQGPTLPQHIMGAMGNWITESVNAIDFFQTLGEVLYHPELKKTYEDHRAMYTSIGKWHVPAASVAALYSSHTSALLGWPWVAHPAVAANGQPYFRGGGYVSGFNPRGLFSPMENLPPGPAYESDAVDDGMLDHDQVNKYRVIVDSDTAVLDETTIKGIEQYVTQGGIFVAYGETGRHTPSQPDSWPISRLTGCVPASEKISGPGTIALDPKQQLLAAGTTFTGNMDGHRLKTVAKDVQTIASWNDGSLAVGLRQIGKGCVITVGPFFHGANGNAFFSALFQSQKIDAIPAHLETASTRVIWRHYISNNGLYDVWTIWNKDSKQPLQGTLVLDAPLRPGWMVDLNSGARSTVTDGKLPVNLPPFELAMLITPRANVAAAPSEWLALQRGWWEGTAPTGAPFPKPHLKMITDLTDGWSFQPLEDKQDATPFLAANFDDSQWKKVSLGNFALPDSPDTRHAIIRRSIEIPATWNRGDIGIHLPEIHDWSNARIDGQLVKLPLAFKAGSKHEIAIEIRCPDNRLGSVSPSWLFYHPDPPAKQDISASFQSSPDFMKWSGTAAIPGPVEKGTHALRTTITLDPAARGKTVVLHATQRSSELSAIVINGHYVSSGRDSEINANITPWVLPGKPNDLVLVMGGSAEDINTLAFEFYTPGTYP